MAFFVSILTEVYSRHGSIYVQVQDIYQLLVEAYLNIQV